MRRKRHIHPAITAHNKTINNYNKTIYCTYQITFSALTLLVEQQEEYLACKKTECWDAVMVLCLGQGADLHGPSDAIAIHCLLL